MTEIPSASGARGSGDIYQHLLTWQRVLRLLHEPSRVTHVAFEVGDAGNVDDLVVHRKDGPPLYHQIKFVMSQSELLTHEWFTTIPRGAKKAPLDRFYESYTKLSENSGPPEMALFTNRMLTGDDPLLTCLDGRTNKLVPRLRRERPGSPAAVIRKQWADRLKITENELYEFLEHVEARAGRDSLEELRENCAFLMEAVRLRGDVGAVELGSAWIAKLISDGCRGLDVEAMREIVATLDLAAPEPRATLVIQALKPSAGADVATAAVDWVDEFVGDDPRQRRQLHDPAQWNGRLKSELQDAAAAVRADSHRTVLIAGDYRLSTGMFAGTELADVAKFRVVVPTRDGEWSSAGEQEPFELISSVTEIGQGDDLAIGLSVTGDLSDDVLDYISDAKLPVARFINISPSSGTGRDALQSAAHARGWARATFDELRQLTRRHSGTLHLFISGPIGGAVLLGNLWNRMPETQLYDDLGPGRGYAPTFLLAG
jgi:CBASS immunity sensor of nucleotide second messenger signals